MPDTCEHCGKIFSRHTNYRRHLSSMHGEEKEDSEEESQHEDSNEEEEDDEPYVENEDVDEVKKYWRDIVSNAASKLDYDSDEDLLKEPLLSQMVDEMRKIVEHCLSFGNFMLSNSEIYEKIQRRKTHLENNDGPSDDDEELTETAWNDNRFRLRKVIKESFEIIWQVEANETEEVDEILPTFQPFFRKK